MTQPIRQGDGAPDPEDPIAAIDGIWYAGQKNVTHWVQLEDFAQGDFVVGDIVTIHPFAPDAYGVTDGVIRWIRPRSNGAWWTWTTRTTA